MSRRLLPILTLVAALAVSCSPSPTTAPTATPPPGGLTSGAAIAQAQQHAEPHDGALAVVSATPGEFRSLGGGIVMKDVAPDRWVWAVTFSGSFRAPCGTPVAGAPGCSSGAVVTHETVVIDYLTGALIVASTGP